MMRISVEALRKDIEPAFDWIGGLIGAALDRKIAALEQQERSSPLLTNHFREQLALEFALAKARKYRKSTGRLPKGPEYDHLYGFLVPASRIHSALPAKARTPFEGRLRDAVSGANGARPFAYEIAIAAHIMGKGWDVEFADYAGTARFDLIARKDEAEIEIECKTTSHDGGRKIRRQDVNRLADLLLPVTHNLAQAAGCHRILIRVPDRLGKSSEELANIAQITTKAVEQKGAASSPVAHVEYVADSLVSWPEPDRDRQAADKFFEERFGVQNAHLLFYGQRGFSIVAVLFVSERPDRVVDSIASQAKEAADQFSGTRPALIALDFVDLISSTELKSLLANPSGVHKVAGDVFKGMSRLHVDTVAFTVPQTTQVDGTGARWLSGDMITLNNPEPRFPCAEIRKIFRR